jgi:hypothetical protein
MSTINKTCFNLKLLLNISKIDCENDNNIIMDEQFKKIIENTINQETLTSILSESRNIRIKLYYLQPSVNNLPTQIKTTISINNIKVKDFFKIINYNGNPFIYYDELLNGLYEYLNKLTNEITDETTAEDFFSNPILKKIDINNYLKFENVFIVLETLENILNQFSRQLKL